jgi:hypothetical protein
MEDVRAETSSHEADRDTVRHRAFLADGLQTMFRVTHYPKALSGAAFAIHRKAAISSRSRELSSLAGDYEGQRCAKNGSWLSGAR